MSDFADIASDIEAENLAIILANRTKMPIGVSAVNCDECDNEIPEARRLALPGIQTCVNCAQLLEDTNNFNLGKWK